MKENETKNTVHEVLTGIIDSVLLVREAYAKDGIRIAHGGKRIEVNFDLYLLRPGDPSSAKFSIPLLIPNPKPETAELDGPRLPITGSTKIEDAGFSGRVRNCLRRGDIKTVHDLLAVPDREELLSIHGLGHIGLQEIEDFISKCGIDETN
jgi:hypothetical protein